MVGRVARLAGNRNRATLPRPEPACERRRAFRLHLEGASTPIVDVGPVIAPGLRRVGGFLEASVLESLAVFGKGDPPCVIVGEARPVQSLVRPPNLPGIEASVGHTVWRQQFRIKRGRLEHAEARR